jgi:hypothetical protein
MCSGLVFAAVAAAALLHPRLSSLLGRRAAVLAAGAALTTRGASRAVAAAGFGGDEGPQKQLQTVADSQRKLEELQSQLERSVGSAEEDAVFVLRTSTLYFQETVADLQAALAGMPRLESAERERAAASAVRFAEQYALLKAACRERAPRAVLRERAAAASAAIGDFLAASNTRYSLPSDDSPADFSSDPRLFAKQYFGFLSCEGQGLERSPGSNTCRDPRQTDEASPMTNKDLLGGFGALPKDGPGAMRLLLDPLTGGPAR